MYEYIQGRKGNNKIVTKIAVYSSDGWDDFSPQGRSPKKAEVVQEVLSQDKGQRIAIGQVQ